MLLVKKVQGPERINVGDRVTYSVGAFNEAHPAAEETRAVSWLVKTENGTALAHIHAGGPIWTTTVPESWAGLAIRVMPYMRSASTNICVRTQVAPLPVDLQPPAKTVAVEIFQENRRYYASINREPRFYVGSDVRYGTLRGLMNGANPYGPRYDPHAVEDRYDFWAYYLLPTIQCESKGAFNCINTYDRARFTYGHMQFAAHTANANFVSLFRELLGLPLSAAYFPELIVVDGHIHHREVGRTIALESDTTTEPLQTFLNPDGRAVTSASVIVAAKLMDWCARDPKFVGAMTDFAIRDQQQKLRRHAQKLSLDGISDKLCLVVLDILHQGRGKYATIAAALGSPDPFDTLLNIGISQYGERTATLRKEILDLEWRGIVGHRAYDLAKADFVPATGA